MAAVAAHDAHELLVTLLHYADAGSSRLDRVLRAEGTNDFWRSGMTDFRAFVLLDLFGAGVFRLLFSVVLAALVGAAAAALTLGPC